MAKRRLNNKLILAIYHIAARQKFVGIVHDQPDAGSAIMQSGRGIQCSAKPVRPADGAAGQLI